MSKVYKIGDIIDVRIEKIVPRGFGIAFVENLTVLVPLSVPGDDLRVLITEIKKRLAFAEVVEVKLAGPQRVVPPCKYFGRCGGCDFQQMSYAAQLEAKVGIIRDCLHRIGKIEYGDDIQIIPSPQELHYRSRARWHIDGDKPAIGYFARDSHNVIDVTTCPILTPETQKAFESVRESIQAETRFDERFEVEAATDEGGNASVLSTQLNESMAELSFVADDFTWLYSAKIFFQANKFLIQQLTDVAVGGASGGTAFDLYCGVGLFTLPMAKHFEKVVAVEENSITVNFAKKNVAGAGLRNVKIVDKSVERFVSENKTKDIDFILIDPPRAGTEKNVIARLAALKPSQISYVSCEPSILARDLRILIDKGYAIEKITALDMFPQTHHVETVVRLKAEPPA
ncbi:MAG: class I SAM-dependent RNA methyltransferase [Pyrinomonadaceae bacterium]